MAIIDDIQRLQFHDLESAQALTLRWLRDDLRLDASAVTLQPKAVSLNSFNGFATVDGEEVFFKSHVEPDSVIAEYYNSQALHDAGYNIVLPLRTVHESGQQIAFYPRITAPVVFDLMRQVEIGEADDATADSILDAERAECSRLFAIYTANAADTSAEQNAKAPIHQLFWHRLTGERYKAFYGSSSILLPEAQGEMRFADLLSKRFVVNGVEQRRTLTELMDEATRVLDPAQSMRTVPGHGDAHFGNVFLEDDGRYLYFDPAFGGHHSPILDLVKPLYHNVFAQWMYFPEDKATQLRTTVNFLPGRTEISYESYVPTVRKSILEIKQSELIAPVVNWLMESKALPSGSRMFHLALMCCPLLTMNISDSAKFSPEVAWAALGQVLQMGNWDTEQNFRL